MIIDCAIYEKGQRQDGAVGLEHAYEKCREKGSFAWIGLYEPSEGEFDSIKREFDLHELAVEDAVKAHQRPKIEVYDEMVFVILKTARYVDSEEVVEFGEIAIFLGEDFIITVRHGEATALKTVRKDLEGRPELLQCGPSAVFHAIIDRVVDDYFPALDGLGEDVEQVEAQVFSSDRLNAAERIYKLKREVIEFDRAAAPLVEPIDRLASGMYETIHPEVQTYFRDVNDHLLRAHEQLVGMRELLTSILQANLAQVTVRQNEDVRKISAWVAILAVPTAMAGIYGMNFDHMPELKWELGYPLVLATMATICVSLYFWFKRAGWL